MVNFNFVANQTHKNMFSLPKMQKLMLPNNNKQITNYKPRQLEYKLPCYKLFRFDSTDFRKLNSKNMFPEQLD